MRMPEAGELNKRVAIYRWKETPEQTGGLDRDWSLIGERWAKVEVVGSQQFWGSAQIEEKITHRVWFRYVKGYTDQLTLTGRTQLVYDGFVFRVKRVTDFEERHLFMLAEIELLGTDEDGLDDAD